MEKKRLQQTLQELRDLLSEEGDVDAQTRSELQQVLEPLQKLLQRDEALSQEDVRPVDRGLKELLLRFESEHPQLASILGRIADGLANLGI